MDMSLDSSIIYNNDESFDDQTSDLEGYYGVHDWSSSPNDAVVGIGYTSYEVNPNNYIELMNKWREYFISRPDTYNVTPVVYLNSDPQRFDDLDIYNLVKARSSK